MIPRPTREQWGALSAFAWTDDARRLWRHMTPPEQRAVLAAADAELEASRCYLVADDAVTKVKRRWERNRRVGHGGRR